MEYFWEVWTSNAWILPLRSEMLTPLMKVLTHQGGVKYIFYILSAGFWAWRKESFRRLIILLMIGWVLIVTLKDLFMDPRPSDAEHLVYAHSYGFPSGHALAAVILYIGLAIEINRPQAWIICIFFTLGISFSRIYLGVHDLEDVVWGMAIGGFVLAFFYTLKDALNRLRERLSLSLQIGILAGFTALWLTFYPSQINYGAALVSGIILFQGVGLLLEERFLNFEPPQSIWRRIGATVLGLLGLMALFHGEAILGPFLLASSASFWQTFCAPYLFQKLRIYD